MTHEFTLPEGLDAEVKAELEARAGINKILRGECPAGAVSPMACMFCHYGHMLECHYPLTCEEAQCSHWQAEQAWGGRERPEDPI